MNRWVDMKGVGSIVFLFPLYGAFTGGVYDTDNGYPELGLCVCCSRPEIPIILEILYRESYLQGKGDRSVAAHERIIYTCTIYLGNGGIVM